MQAAARSLGMELEVLYAERDPKRTLALAQEIARRAPGRRPDYVILVNEKGTLVDSAQALGTAGIRSFAAYSGLLPQERNNWSPRVGLPLLLGSLEPRARDAGYLTARALIELGLQNPHYRRQGMLQFLALAGDRSTPTSIQRNEGMRQAVAEFPQVVLREQVLGDWRRDLARDKVSGLLQRHPDATLLWAASDLMAFGAMDAMEARALKPGQDMLVSAINTSGEAMQARLEGRLSALAGGHFMAGAWAMVMLYDHHRGRDFIDEGLELERPMFMLFDKQQATRFLARFHSGIRLDFRPYSKALNPQIKRYQFGLEALLK